MRISRETTKTIAQSFHCSELPVYRENWNIGCPYSTLVRISQQLKRRRKDSRRILSSRQIRGCQLDGSEMLEAVIHNWCPPWNHSDTVPACQSLQCTLTITSLSKAPGRSKSRSQGEGLASYSFPAYRQCPSLAISNRKVRRSFSLSK